GGIFVFSEISQTYFTRATCCPYWGRCRHFRRFWLPIRQIRRYTKSFVQTSFNEASPMSEVTRILSAIEQGNPRAAEQLLPLVYDELRQLAARKLAQEKPGQTLQPTALVHEAYLRLVGDGNEQSWDN